MNMLISSRQLAKSLFIFLALLISSSNIASAANYLTLKYSAKEGDSLKSIMIYFLKDKVEPAAANEALKLTMKANPSVKSWNPLKSDTTFKLYLNPIVTDLKKYHAYYTANKTNNVHHIKLSTAPSIGFYSQSNKDGLGLKYTQISLVSVGVNYLYNPYKKMLHFNVGAFYSSISSTSNQVNANNTNIEIPPEYGGYFHLIYNNESSKQFAFYAGADFENFSSFNMESILRDNNIVIDANTFYYVTVGLIYSPEFMKKGQFNFSLSKSVASAFESAISSNQTVKLEGMKFTANTEYSFNENWSANLYFKTHKLTGDNEMTINRLGVGINYNLF